MHERDGTEPPSPVFLREDELAQRWRIAPRTLQRWRRAGTGPRHLRIGARIVYPLDDVVAFEAACSGKRGGRT